MSSQSQNVKTRTSIKRKPFTGIAQSRNTSTLLENIEILYLYYNMNQEPLKKFSGLTWLQERPTQKPSEFLWGYVKSMVPDTQQPTTLK